MPKKKKKKKKKKKQKKKKKKNANEPNEPNEPNAWANAFLRTNGAAIQPNDATASNPTDAAEPEREGRLALPRRSGGANGRPDHLPALQAVRANLQPEDLPVLEEKGPRTCDDDLCNARAGREGQK